MRKTYTAMTRLLVSASCLIPFTMWMFNVARKVTGRANPCSWEALWSKLGLLIILSIAAGVIVWNLEKRAGMWLDHCADLQAKALRTLRARQADLGIALAACLSLLLELSMIRWQASLFELFAFYKNFSLLACFLGLGLGYALSRADRIPLILVIPLMAWQFLLLAATKFGPEGWNVGLYGLIPIAEQLNMGAMIATEIYHFIPVYYFLLVVFVLTALAFVPVGQLCGALMHLRPRLRAYGLNLLGSIAGVIIVFILSMWWTPPVIWFTLCFGGLLLFQGYARRSLAVGIASMAIVVVVMTWPTSTFWEQIYSPYQLLERGFGQNTVTRVRAAGSYYQEIHNYAHLKDSDPRDATASYYELPYRLVGQPDQVAVVGSGTGNDVAAALRCGVRHVDAIEIDPAIMQIGKSYHPEHPYSDARVTPVVNDARTFLRTTDKTYDMIVYGLLDSHTLLSHASSVRLDSFVYTVEAFREARARLKPGGTLSLAFSLLAPELGRKIYLMLEDAFDGNKPVCIQSTKDGGVIFLIQNGAEIVISEGLIDGEHLIDVSSSFGNPLLEADVSTDDWPFFYMPKRVYPLSYVIVVLLVLVVSVLFVLPFFRGPTLEWRDPNNMVFFFLGAGFMLIETKAITEMGLSFGNTWHVIGIAITGILVMAYLANLLVTKWEISRVAGPFVLLLVALGLGLWTAKAGGLGAGLPGKLGTVLILTCPIFFSGICFSAMLRHARDIGGVMAANLIGSMTGGLLEYNSMYFGFTWLYWLALGIYVLAMLAAVYSRTAVRRKRLQFEQDA